MVSHPLYVRGFVILCPVRLSSHGRVQVQCTMIPCKDNSAGVSGFYSASRGQLPTLD